jgi:hypothetical protein
MSHATKIKNVHDHRTYWVSTLRNPAGVWETAILEAGFLGLLLPKILCGVSPLTPEQISLLGPDAGLNLMARGILLIPVKAISEENINWIHAKIVDIARDYPRDIWQGIIAKVVPEYLRGQGLLEDDIGGDTPKDDRAIESISSILEESLFERAGILAQALIMWADAAKDLFLQIGVQIGEGGEDGREIPLDGLHQETLLFFLHVMDRIAWDRIPKYRDTFILSLLAATYAALTQRHVEWVRTLTMKKFLELFDAAQNEYGEYQFYRSGQNPKGTLFWEFGKKISRIMEGEYDIAIMVPVEHFVTKCLTSISWDKVFWPLG